MTPEQVPAQRRNQSVQKAAALLRAAAATPEGVTVSELARRAALPRATAGRMVEALLAERFLRRLPDTLERHASRTITRGDELEAELETIRRQRYAEIVDELEDGLAAVSVPVFLDGQLIASINASGPRERFDAAERARGLPALRDAAADVERRLR